MIRYLLAGLLFFPSFLYAQTPAPSTADTGQVSATAPPSVKGTWTIDTAHSALTFNLRLFAGRAQGRFNTWSGTITAPSDDWEDAAVNVVIQAASVDTKNKKRDAHLRNEDFFDVEKYPVLTFKSTKIEREGDSVTVHGNLTIKDVTKPVILKGKFLEATPGPVARMNFQATTTINRLDYGVNYDAIFVRDKIVLGEDVTIELSVAAVRQ